MPLSKRILHRTLFLASLLISKQQYITMECRTPIIRIACTWRGDRNMRNNILYHKNKIKKILLYVSKSLRSSLFSGAVQRRLVNYWRFGKAYHNVKTSSWACLSLYAGLIHNLETSVTNSYCVTTWEKKDFNYITEKAWNMVIWYWCYSLMQRLVPEVLSFLQFPRISSGLTSKQKWVPIFVFEFRHILSFTCISWIALGKVVKTWPR
jgi:hypothetical protein